MGVKKKVVIFGGGIGGLSVAHELTEGARAQHFDVEIVEPDAVFGGKAQSGRVAGNPAHPNGYPGEHGFRFFPTFYRHVIDTMARIPSPFGGSVADHLVSTPTRMIAGNAGSPIVMPTKPAGPLDLLQPGNIQNFIGALLGPGVAIGVLDLEFFASRLILLATSCRERRLACFEHQSWWDFLDADNRSPEYKHYLASGLTRTLVAAKPNEINAMTGGDVLIRLLVDTVVPDVNAKADRVLDGPTNEVWIKPWLAELTTRNVTFTKGSLFSLQLGAGSSIAGATVLVNGNPVSMTADYYVSALPVERMAEVLDRSAAVLNKGQRLDGVTNSLRNQVRSMTGLQLYLDRPFNQVPHDMGHQLYVDSDWALTSIAQSNFWAPPFKELSGYGAGNIKVIWSTIISGWDQPDAKGLRADFATRDQLKQGTIAQLESSLNADGVVRFDKASVVAWNLDPALTPGPEVGPGQPARNTMQLLVNFPDSWKTRPDAAPAGLDNLLLASDYVRTNTSLATMEGANEAARRAVNAILRKAKIAGQKCRIFDLYYPEVMSGDPVWKTLIDIDSLKFKAFGC